MVALNPFQGLERVHTRKKTTIPATREQAAAMAQALADIGHPALGAAALIAFEWHQRPENIIAGHLAWTDYRPADRPAAVRLFHHKTKSTYGCHSNTVDDGSTLSSKIGFRGYRGSGCL